MGFFKKHLLLLFGAAALGLVVFFGINSHRASVSQPLSSRHPTTLQTQVSSSSPSRTSASNEEEDFFQPILGKPKQVAISPVQIYRLVQKRKGQSYIDLKDIWRELGIFSQREYREYGECQCRIKSKPIHLDSEPGAEILLQLRSGSETNRFLIFKSLTNRVWYFLGGIEVFDRFNDCSYEVVRAGHKRWLVITSRAGWGVGSGGYRSNWYEVGGQGIKRVLTYMSNCWDWNNSLNRELGSRILSSDQAWAVVEFNVKYQTGSFLQEKLKPLFSDSSKVSFRWDDKLERFVFDPHRTGFSEQEFDSIYQVEDPFDTDNFISHYRTKFLKLDGSRQQRLLLKKILNEIPNSPEKQSLIFSLTHKNFYMN